jgi:hypothetical protein
MFWGLMVTAVVMAWCWTRIKVRPSWSRIVSARGAYCGVGQQGAELSGDSGFPATGEISRPDSAPAYTWVQPAPQDRRPLRT